MAGVATYRGAWLLSFTEPNCPLNNSRGRRLCARGPREILSLKASASSDLRGLENRGRGERVGASSRFKKNLRDTSSDVTMEDKERERDKEFEELNV